MSQRASSVGQRKPPGPSEAFRNAVAFHYQRRFWEAEQLYKRVLKADERHFGGLYQLGLLYLQQSKFEDAARMLRRAADADKDSVEALHHLAIALMAIGRPEEAIQRYQRALVIRPDVAEIHNNLGHALQTLGRTEAAIAHYDNALAIKPEYAEAHNNLGNALHKTGRSQDAIDHYQRALAINPNYAEACNNFANALVALGRHQEAITHHQKAIAISPKNAEAYDHLGKTLHMLGRSQEAIAYHEQAIAITPEDAEFHSNLGQTLHAIGQLDKASQAFQRAISLSGDKGRYYWSLAQSKHFTSGDPHLAQMEGLARNMARLGPEQQVELHFALGKAYADLGDQERSFQHLLEANSRKRRQIEYDVSTDIDQFRRVQSIFTAELMHDKAELGDPSHIPVFIFGMPRSGTSLIEQVLASHPRVFGAGELTEMGRFAASIHGPEGVSFPEAVPSLSGQQLRQVGAGYLRATRCLAPDGERERITDKMPANFVYAGLINLVLPNARIIHARRDLRDTALSCFSILWPNTQQYSCDLGELGRYCRGYDQLMRHWRKVIPPGVMLEVRYEDLVHDLENHARRIVAHCGLEWDDACLAFHKTERSVRTASATQVRQPIYRSSVGRWRPHEHLLQPLLTELEGMEAG